MQHFQTAFISSGTGRYGNAEAGQKTPPAIGVIDCIPSDTHTSVDAQGRREFVVQKPGGDYTELAGRDLFDTGARLRPGIRTG